jgi:hypothetical protein
MSTGDATITLELSLTIGQRNVLKRTDVDTCPAARAKVGIYFYSNFLIHVDYGSTRSP